MLTINCMIFCVLIVIVNAGVELTYISDNINGQYRGKVLQTIFDNKYYIAFKGIPYAKPPIGELRFKPPVPIEPPTTPYDAFNFQNDCVQPAFDRKSIIGNEDCLHLNIYTPAEINIKPDRYPVMFFIHGGSYFEGSGNDFLYGPDFLIQNQDIVLVTINYRLGPFGFMSLGSPEYSGNMGLKDQLLALKWVNDNINSFGGDKNRITIFGHSAGGSSVHHHIISPASRGLFQRAIAMSGTAINGFGMSSARIHIRIMFEFAKKLNKEIKGFENLIDYLKIVDPYTIIKELVLSNTGYTPGSSRKNVDIIWAPVIEIDKSADAFLTDFPQNILNNNFKSDVDAMFGFVDAETLFVLSPELNQPELLKEFDEKFEIEFPKYPLKMDYASKIYKNLAEKIRTFYFGENGHVNNDTLTEYNQLLSDTVFVYGIDKSVKIQAKQSSANTFYYRFSVMGSLNTFRTAFNVPNYVPGASHADELCYLFKCKILPNLYDNLAENSIERTVIKQITKLWTNFAIYGNPTPNADPVAFQPIKNDLINFLDIGNTGLITELNPHSKFLTFWDKIIDDYESNRRYNLNRIRKDEL